MERLIVPTIFKQYLTTQLDKGLKTRKDMATNFYTLSSVTKRKNLEFAFVQLINEIKNKKIQLKKAVDLSHIEFNPQIINSNHQSNNCDPIAIRKIAKSQYPNDKAMEEYIFKNQLAACKYMLNTTDPEVKKIVENQYPNDFSMQKYTYDSQYAAKLYMNSVTNSEAKKTAIKEYPNDYVMQKYIYDKLVY